MALFKEGDRVKVKTEGMSAEERAMHGIYDYMLHLRGTVENHYGVNEVAVKVDLDSLPPIARKVHTDASNRMRDKFVDSVGEEQRKMLTKEELEFTPNYVILVREADLEKA